ncbi:MAG: hypothetical protein LBV26_03180 [Bacteroidales bacterium]|jgi:hypothetical protein|nr:hypothetical protein [Bacteroidales bacterium]
MFTGRFKYYIFLLTFFLACAACAPSKKKSYYKARRIEASKANSTQLGRNRYFYSPGYRKKLSKTYRNVNRNRM